MEASSTEQPTCAQRVHAAWQSRREDLKAMLDPSAEDMTIEREGNDYIMIVAERTVTNDNGADLDISKSLDLQGIDPDPDSWPELFMRGVCDSIFEEYEGEIRGTAGEAFYEYGLCFDYVAPGTFDQQDTGYWRYQISWGGPSEEIRFYGSPSDNAPALIEFWYLDWFDGAPEDVTSDEIARLVWDEFSDMDMLRSTYEEAME